VLGRLTTQADLDFTTDARPEVVQRMVRSWADALWDTGIEYGTVGVGKAGRRLEITTFRADSYDQVSRNPQVRYGERLDDDLVRRDFTVNAMAVRITGEVRGVHRSAGWVGRTAAADPGHPGGAGGLLRRRPVAHAAGRAVRLPAAVHRLRPGARGDHRDGAELARITVERVAVELDKMLLGADPVAGIDLMVQTGMGEVVLPEIGGMQMAIDEHHQHKDVYQHSLTVLRQAIARSGGQERSDSGGNRRARSGAAVGCAAA
jgi:poly(A) polymerase